MEWKRGRLIYDDSESIETVTKRQRSLIDHPSFIESHTRQVISSSSSTISNPKRFGNYLIPNSSTSSSGLFLSAQQYCKKFRLRFIEYNDHVDGKKLVSELKHSKLIIGHVDDSWGFLLISSCNGLVFMGLTIPNYINDMFVCNPFTREYVNLRTKSNTNTNTKEEERHSHLERKGRMTYGFGYLPSTNEYKIVSVYYPYDMNGRKGKVSVYTLGSGRWRNKGEIPYWLKNVFHPGFFANGAIHWFNYTDKKKIVTFDLANEEFRMVVPSPPPASSANYHVDELGVLGGCLCVTRRCESLQHIWVLNVNTKEKGEEEFSWNKKFSIPWKSTCIWNVEPLVILRCGKVLLLGGTALISYDSKTGASMSLKEASP